MVIWWPPALAPGFAPAGFQSKLKERMGRPLLAANELLRKINRATTRVLACVEALLPKNLGSLCELQVV